MDVQERLARARALAKEVPPPPPPRALVLRFVAAVAMIAYGAWWVIRHLHGPEMLVFLAVWFVAMTTGAKFAYAALTGVFSRTAVVVTAKYVHRDAPIVLHHLVVEDGDGNRTTHLVPARVYESASISDVGILFAKRGQVWGFYRVE